MKLTKKQLALVKLLAEGEDQKTAAVKLGMKHQAAASAIYKARHNNGMNTATQLAVECVRRKII